MVRGASFGIGDGWCSLMYESFFAFDIIICEGSASYCRGRARERAWLDSDSIRTCRDAENLSSLVLLVLLPLLIIFFILDCPCTQFVFLLAADAAAAAAAAVAIESIVLRNHHHRRRISRSPPLPRPSETQPSTCSSLPPRPPIHPAPKSSLPPMALSHPSIPWFVHKRLGQIIAYDDPECGVRSSRAVLSSSSLVTVGGVWDRVHVHVQDLADLYMLFVLRMYPRENGDVEGVLESG
ncbi:hypothetical protein K504DRAFT_214508 [Pleomassaria siparia CBS 279.74]|uniref:Uncharacterized protein n=1 Tax=Pleomassaria siparia CBS 279.74 TaxID=1314801 RepID=A0A6G1JQ53_9PLEO|nr:hypothetical protein K504DRAFT_214508 [Pleomassaria siparia CBS 279.74]